MAPLLARRDRLAQELAGLLVQRDELYRSQEESTVQILTQTRINIELSDKVAAEQSAYDKAVDRTYTDSLRKEHEQVKEDMEKTNTRREIIRNIVQGLIIESGLNWARHPRVLNMMKESGENMIV